jgi:hypothetical protein
MLKKALAQLFIEVVKDFTREPKPYLTLIEALSAHNYHDAICPALLISRNVGVRWLKAMNEYRKVKNARS